jgi:GrpB-like predicted nucleotidyltransferase (UPF0157 family)
MKIILEDYHSDWKIKFQEEKPRLENSLQAFRHQVEHIGSTAVPGLSAKPVIDILIGLYDFNHAAAAVSELCKLEYTYMQEYESLMPYRRFFARDIGGTRAFHIHMVEVNTDFWKRHIAFRDHLLHNLKTQTAYEILKKELAKQEWKDGNEYAAAKNSFIREVEKRIL